MNDSLRVLLVLGTTALVVWACWPERDRASTAGAGAGDLVASSPPPVADALEVAPTSLMRVAPQHPGADADHTDAPLEFQPAAGAPLARHFADLAARARSGEAAAALRLHDEIARCRAQTLVAPGSAPRPPPADPAGQAGWRLMEMRRCVNAQRCRGVVPAMLDDPVQWLWRAAEAGDIEAQVRFSSGEIFEDLAGSSSLDYLQRWQQRAAFWIEHAAAQGHPRAMLLLGHALAQQDGAYWRLLLGDVLPDDPVRGHALLAALARVPELAASASLRSALAIAQPLTPLQQMQAQQQADTLFATHGRRLLATRPEQLRSALQASRYAELDELREQSPQCVAELEAVLAKANAAIER